jgi:hypothetical protein
MPNILIAEGTPAVWQAEHAAFGLPSNFSLFVAAVQLHHPGAHCTLLTSPMARPCRLASRFRVSTV